MHHYPFRISMEKGWRMYKKIKSSRRRVGNQGPPRLVCVGFMK
jgi:hypothetical protein